ncbi:hypothetical protein BD410DRAFT_790355 [Rickenella mellea]|uniref:Uncharacterized protein n=1 Tax=Rickenella mellea TaxID=50990 RepID=A0A4Y7Q104_9AGAM|nr:hypothetical protein BD410DRAFT_790355 [Rickenella mellea]
MIFFGDEESHSKSYWVAAYIDSDYPENYSMEELKPVLLVVEESVHYPLEGSQALLEWSSNAPSGIGYVCLGQTHRILCVSMFHQLHYLRYIRNGIVNPSDPSSSIYHSHNCLNYIRQSILCNSDLTLEPFDPLDRNFTVDRIGATHVCRDWSAVYGEIGSIGDHFGMERRKIQNALHIPVDVYPEPYRFHPCYETLKGK